MNTTPQAKTSNFPGPVARTQSAPSTSNAVATEVDLAYIDGKAYPINKNETMLAFIRRTADIGSKPAPTLCDTPNLEPFGSCCVCSVEVALQEDGLPAYHLIQPTAPTNSPFVR